MEFRKTVVQGSASCFYTMRSSYLQKCSFAFCANLQQTLGSILFLRLFIVILSCLIVLLLYTFKVLELCVWVKCQTVGFTDTMGRSDQAV